MSLGERICTFQQSALGCRNTCVIVEILDHDEHARFVTKQSNRVSLWDVEVSGAQCRVVYDSRRRNIVTVLRSRCPEFSRGRARATIETPKGRFMCRKILRSSASRPIREELIQPGRT